MYRQALIKYPEATGYNSVLQMVRLCATGPERTLFKSLRQVTRLEGYRFEEVFWSYDAVHMENKDLLVRSTEISRMLTIHVPREGKQ